MHRRAAMTLLPAAPLAQRVHARTPRRVVVTGAGRGGGSAALTIAECA